MAVQFGELDFEGRANRTSRYVVTAREALQRLGVQSPGDHIMVAAHLTDDLGDLSTILVKRTPFTRAEVEAFGGTVAQATDHVPIYAPGDGADLAGLGDHLVNRLAGGSDTEVDALVAGHNREIDAVTDDAPFLWHFSDFPDVLRDITTSIDVRDIESDMVGERVLLLLLLMALVYAAVFLLLPFVTVHKTWATLPSKGISGVYFAALGLGFMLFEITMIHGWCCPRRGGGTGGGPDRRRSAIRGLTARQSSPTSARRPFVASVCDRPVLSWRGSAGERRRSVVPRRGALVPGGRPRRGLRRGAGPGRSGR
jgi:hypothetical protein